MLVERIYEWARTTPTRVAMVHNDAHVTYLRFACAIDAARREFDAANLSPGSMGVLILPGLAHAWAACLALRSLGVTTMSARSLSEVAEFSLQKVSCIVISQKASSSADDGALLQRYAGQGIKILAMPDDLYAVQNDHLPIPYENAPAFGGHILRTSGTTGHYKKILFRGGQENARNTARARTLAFDGNTRHHGLGFSLATGAGFKQPSALWWVGGSIIFDQRRDVYAHIFKNGATCIAPLPKMLSEILAIRAKDGVSSKAHPGFMLSVSSGFLPLSTAERAMRELADRLVVRFSATELVGVPLQRTFRSAEDLYWLAPHDGSVVEVVDEEGRECAPGVEGDLRIQLTDIDCGSYLDDLETSGEIFRNGYFHPGDRAVRRADGLFRILGRSADVLNLHGEKIAVAPLEQQLQAQLGVEEVCLFSRMTDDAEEEIAITIRAGHDVTALRIDWLKKLFATFSKIRILVLKEFPCTESDTRKTRRPLLRQWVFLETEPPHCVGFHIVSRAKTTAL